MWHFHTTQRQGMRKPIVKTYDITPDAYALFLSLCEKYNNNIAWKYPAQCPDGLGCCGLDRILFDRDLKYEIPSLFRDYNDCIVAPRSYNVHGIGCTHEEFDQFALLDYIEFYAQNIRDAEITDYHRYFGHHHLNCKTSNAIYKQFQTDVNALFGKTGLLYRLTDEKMIERIVENTPLTEEIESQISQIKETGTRELLAEAIRLYRQPYPESRKNAVEKIWDALERLKTYYTDLDKKKSAAKIVNDMADGNVNYFDLFNAEFDALTKIGNNYRIRHHETNKIDITDPRHYDYFFNRCLSLIALAIQYLQ